MSVVLSEPGFLQWSWLTFPIQCSSTDLLLPTDYVISCVHTTMLNLICFFECKMLTQFPVKIKRARLHTDRLRIDYDRAGKVNQLYSHSFPPSSPIPPLDDFCVRREDFIFFCRKGTRNMGDTTLFPNCNCYMASVHITLFYIIPSLRSQHIFLISGDKASHKCQRSSRHCWSTNSRLIWSRRIPWVIYFLSNFYWTLYILLN